MIDARAAAAEVADEVRVPRVWRPWMGFALAVAPAVVVALARPTFAAPDTTPALDPVRVRQEARAAGLDTLAAHPPPNGVFGDVLNTSAGGTRAAVQLGKALFWDMQAGSDGQACASCHFHAGADDRAKNQLSPGLLHGDTTFGNSGVPNAPGHPSFKPNATLTAADFPFLKPGKGEDHESSFTLRGVAFDTDDVASSQGVFDAQFGGVVPGARSDLGTDLFDSVFNVAGTNVRRVEPRNTPTMINAIYNLRNFWDGRANNHFNGRNPFGALDSSALVWASDAGGLHQVALATDNASLASQADGPPLSTMEMSFDGRQFFDLGRKLLSRPPLEYQAISPQDSVLAPLVAGGQPTTTTYRDLVRAAFNPRYWDSSSAVPCGSSTCTLDEANFSLFWGAAIQQYEATLVSDRTPFDRFMAGDNRALTPRQLRGLLVFINHGQPPPGQGNANIFNGVSTGNCVSCHSGPVFTAAANDANHTTTTRLTATLVNGQLGVGTDTAGADVGFSNIGVRPTEEDIGRGGTAPSGAPLSFVRRTSPSGTRDDVQGAFKVPGLRNVALTGPYFHNGGQATLSQVVDFYDRQSDFGARNLHDLDPDVARIDLNEADEVPLVEFLMALTDDRVADERAPFDHPMIVIPNGERGDSTSVVQCASSSTASRACDDTLSIPAIGAAGRRAAGLPILGPFLGLSPTTR